MGNGNENENAYDQGDYNSSLALSAVELKGRLSHDGANGTHDTVLLTIIHIRLSFFKITL